MSGRSGRYHFAYWNTGTYGSPTWNQITGARDVSVSQTREVVEFDSRGHVVRTVAVTSLSIEVSIELLYERASGDIDALRTAFLNRANLDVLLLDGQVTTSGSKGLRFTGLITEFTQNEPLSDAVTVSITMRPSESAEHPPELFTVP